ncbi:MAG: glucose-1-phosphate adenylyltransferase subunit GlgD [Defluviitaleaceae bacterium]|nr:glucose-1-phosphate adenylyltransferase subunit GlgD [Defluviitaleaceae bacterium]
MRAVGIILAGGQSDRLRELSAVRATPAMPVGSCYRAIDFPLSNMANSGIRKVAVITQYNSRSLHDHLNSSKWWGFGRKQGGLFVLAPFLSKEGNFGFRGTADSIHQNISFLERSKEPYVVITGGDGIYKMDYNAVLDFHIQRDADITVVCKDVHGMDVTNFGVVALGENGRITHFEEKPLEAFSNTISLGIYIIKRTLLIELLGTIISEGRFDFVRDIVERYRKRLNIYGFMYNDYWAVINSAQSYFNINMDFLRTDIRNMFFAQEPFIETKNKDEPPAKYNAHSQVKNCLVGCGSIIDGLAENSVLFRRVKVGEGAAVRNSVIMEGCHIYPGAIVVNAILDKNVKVLSGAEVIGGAGEPKVIMKGSVV